MKKLTLVLAVLLLCAAHLIASVAFINHVEDGDTQNGVTTDPVDMTGANFIALCVAHIESMVSSVADSSSNVYTPLTPQCASSLCVNLYYVASPTVTSSMTFTVTGTDSFPGVVAMGFSGVKATSPLDQESAGASTTGTTLQPGSITPSEDNTLIVGCLTDQDGMGITVDSGFVSPPYQFPLSSGNHYGISGTYLMQATAAAINPTFTAAASVNLDAIQASFKMAASTSSAVPIFYSIR